jgi:ArsR family transcriptional regulator
MNPIDIYKCLCDMQRLRILNLLAEGPLCVCHIQEILGESQVKVSKQLAYMKKLGVLDARREAHWMIYSLAEPVHPLLAANMAQLRRLAADHPEFALDLAQRPRVVAERRQRDAAPAGVGESAPACCFRSLNPTTP